MTAKMCISDRFEGKFEFEICQWTFLKIWTSPKSKSSGCWSINQSNFFIFIFFHLIWLSFGSKFQKFHEITNSTEIPFHKYSFDPTIPYLMNTYKPIKHKLAIEKRVAIMDLILDWDWSSVALSISLDQSVPWVFFFCLKY